MPSDLSLKRTRLPVLYLHDAQNLFDPKQSYTGATWQITEAMQRLREQVGFEAIVVGMEHGGPRRVSELMPWPIENFVGEAPPAEGAAYLRWIVEVVKPYIDAHYPTRPECEHTAMIGSSLGGLLTHYAAHARPGVFCKVGILSPSYWVSEGPYTFARQQPAPATVRVFMYAGGKESPRMVPDAQRMLKLMRETRPAGSATTLLITPEAGHNEPAWAAAFPQAVRWLFELPAEGAAAPAAAPPAATQTAAPVAAPANAPGTAPAAPATAPAAPSSPAQSAPAHTPSPATPAR